MSSEKKIRELEARHKSLITKLLQKRPMIRGTLGQAYRRCGKPTCWCARGEGHPYLRITWTEQAQSKIKMVRKEDAKWVKKVTDNYRAFRKRRAELRKVHEELNKLLNRFEQEVIAETRQQNPEF